MKTKTIKFTVGVHKDKCCACCYCVAYPVSRAGKVLYVAECKLFDVGLSVDQEEGVRYRISRCDRCQRGENL
jgi:hypothetical protein